MNNSNSVEVKIEVGEIAEKVTIWTAIVISLIGTGIGLLDFCGLKIPYIEHNIPQIILSLIGVLGIAIGLERLTKLESLSQKLAETKRIVETAVTAQKVEGYDEMFDISTQYVRDAEAEINLLIFAGSIVSDPIPGRYLNALNKQLKNSKENRSSVVYRVIIGYDHNLSTEMKDSIRTYIQNRMRIFIEEGVDSQVEYRYINIPFGISLFVVDRKHLLVGFPRRTPNGEVQEFQTGIKFSSNASLVPFVADWFDRYLWDKASNDLK
ncbi:hypothetical protein [Chroococcidiopsis sp. TS-821]|uniref:hypothetical protein n=1 Tax=Chroococcidiopsis sp. TS-821 TaxID=1378066 RepID=UPI000CEEBA4A|nr:hypothetical protein [Chroococcidiopsis sp. TS-821]PPS41911.1 hypothetical protein B1A85_15620 [Chroococcidiopsis sp. TS-821]